MKKLILLAFVLLPVLLSGQVLKGTGISYFDSIPNVAPSLPKGTEIALGIKTKKLYRWDRTCSCWIELETSTDSLARTVLASGLFNEYAVPFGGSTGKLDQSAAFKFILGQLQANSFATLGSAGAGYVGLSPQSSVPATPASGIRVYADASGRFGWIGTNGYTRVFDASGITANRLFKLQNKTYTLADSADVASLSASLPSAYFPLLGGAITGTGGAGFVGFPAQSSNPSTPAGGFRLFANGAGNMAVIRADGYVTTFDFSTATGNRFFTYPANAGTFGILENTQSWTGLNTFSPTGTGGAGFVYSSTTRPSHPLGTVTTSQRDAMTGMAAGDLVYNGTLKRINLWDVSWLAVPTMASGGIGDGHVVRGDANGNVFGSTAFIFRESTTGTFPTNLSISSISTASANNQAVSGAVFEVSFNNSGAYTGLKKNVAAFLTDDTGGASIAIGRPYATDFNTTLTTDFSTRNFIIDTRTSGGSIFLRRQGTTIFTASATEVLANTGDFESLITKTQYGLPTHFFGSAANTGGYLLFRDGGATGYKTAVGHDGDGNLDLIAQRANTSIVSTDTKLKIYGSNGFFRFGNSGTATSFAHFAPPASNVTGDLSGAGYGLRFAAATYTNTTTAASGTVAAASAYSFGVPTIASTNTGVVYTAASTVRIDGPPTASTNTTITNPYALQVVSGVGYFGGNVHLASELHVPFDANIRRLTGSGSHRINLVAGGSGSYRISSVGNLQSGDLSISDNSAGISTIGFSVTTAGSLHRFTVAPLGGANFSISGATATFGTRAIPVTDFAINTTSDNSAGLPSTPIIHGGDANPGAAAGVNGLGGSIHFSSGLGAGSGTDGAIIFSVGSGSGSTSSGVLHTRVEAARFSPSGQFAVGTNAPNAAALLDLVSTTRGLLIPRATNAQIAAVSSPPVGLQMISTDDERIHLKRTSGFFQIAYTQDVKRDTSYQITNTNLDISGQTANFKNRYHTVRIATAVTAAATANNVITMPVPHADLLGINFKVSVVDVSGDSDISQLSFGTDGVDGYLSNGDGTYAPTQNLYPGLGVYVSVAWDQNKSAYRWFLQ